MRKTILCPVLLVLVLSACSQQSSARQMLGMDRKSPDAFSVSPQAPLAVPANLDVAALPAPRPGALRPQQRSPEAEARQTVLGDAASRPAATASSPSPSAGERAILGKTGAMQTDATIRATIDKEAEKDAKDQRGFLDFLVFWRPDPRPGVAVDAKAEAERLNQNKKDGRPVTSGATPVSEDSGRLGAPKEIQ